MTSNNAPIGIFDSGVGGLSVLREIRAYYHLNPFSILPTRAMFHMDRADWTKCGCFRRKLRVFC